MADREQLIDEAFLSACFTYIKKASDDNIYEVVNALQKILQIHAAQELTKQDACSSADTLLNDIFQADESGWEQMIEEHVKNGATPAVAGVVHNSVHCANAFLAQNDSGCAHACHLHRYCGVNWNFHWFSLLLQESSARHRSQKRYKSAWRAQC